MMRATIIFCVAIALGALTVSGQDTGGVNDLKRRIRALLNALMDGAVVEAVIFEGLGVDL